MSGRLMLTWKRVAVLCLVVLTFQALNALLPSAARPTASLWRSRKSGPKDDPTLNDLRPLSLDECQAEFPDLYHEIDRAAAYWKEREHPITSHDTDISWRKSGIFRILIHNNELRILQTRHTFEDQGYRPRTLATLTQIQHALWAAAAVGERVPTLEAAVIVDDVSNIPRQSTYAVWTLTSNATDPAHDRHWLMPDFNFHSGTDPASAYLDIRRRAAAQDAPFAAKRPQAVWRGGTWSNEPLREALMAATTSQPWADTAVVDVRQPDAYLPIDDLCKYALVLHSEGRSYSGRLGFLLNCGGSVPVVHELAWKTHFTHLLVPDGPRQNYLPVRRDWTDLEAQVTGLLADPARGQRIADEAARVFRDRYLSPRATTCYWRRLMHAYAERAVAPQVYEPRANASDEWRMRGIPFEEFVHLTKDYTP